MNISSIEHLVSILKEIESRKIHYTLQRYLDDSISLCVAVPGERWEIDINQFGEMQIEIFKSNGEIHDSEMLDDLFERFAD
jgi:hypothetical protein